MSSTSPLAAGLGWPECPRWHEGQLWFTDMYQRTVFRASPEGIERVCDVPAIPAVTPNGMAIDRSGRFFVAEPLAFRIKVFSMTSSGALVDGRTFATLPAGVMPDGIAVDDHGCVWLASPSTHEVLRIGASGTVERRLSWPQDGPRPVACALGGHDGTELFVCLGDIGPSLDGAAAPATAPAAGPLRGRIESMRAAAGGCGVN